MSKKPYYITTPIYYPSDKFHIGHSYTTVLCDAMARYKRMRGFDVLFLTGTDEHGMKIETAAKNAGVRPKAYVDHIVAGAKDLWKVMDITYDRFIRTTDEYHVKSVQKIFKQLYDQGDIYKGFYEGMYCEPCESFWTESQLVDGMCPDCGRGVQKAKEEAYFFKLSKYTKRIIQLYEEQPDFLQPESRKKEMLNNFLLPGLNDLAVSRTSFSWGIPVEFDKGHVVYVWIDALSNYITALGYGNDAYDDFDKYWPADLHVMAKEIVRFHSVIWPAILMALDLPLPKKVFAHGWLMFDGDKMSKSKGNVVDPHVLVNRYGVDAVRYFYLRDVPIGQDGNFTNTALINRINTDLANDLGNLVSRTVAMVEKYFGGTLPAERQAGEFDEDLTKTLTDLKPRVEELYDNLQFPTATREIFQGVSRVNKYIDETTPWVLAKDEENKPRLATVLYNLLESIRLLSVLLTPILPHTTPEIFRQIGASEEESTWETSGTFGVLSATATVIKGNPLFPRIDVEEELEILEELRLAAIKEGVGEITDHSSQKKAGKQEKKAEEKNEEKTAGIIGIEDFGKVQLVAGEIVACEPVPKADKLLVLQVADGTGIRQVVSGIAPWYSPEDLIGKKIALVANLKPAKLRGVESNGMLLAADVGEDVRVIFLEGDIPNGSIIR